MTFRSPGSEILAACGKSEAEKLLMKGLLRISGGPLALTVAHNEVRSSRRQFTNPEAYYVGRWTDERCPSFGFEFYVQPQIGRYRPDFLFMGAFDNYAIEVDGRTHDDANEVRKDKIRDRRLRKEGVEVRRWLASEVTADPEWVAHDVLYSTYHINKRRLIALADAVLPTVEHMIERRMLLMGHLDTYARVHGGEAEHERFLLELKAGEAPIRWPTPELALEVIGQRLDRASQLAANRDLNPHPYPLPVRDILEGKPDPRTIEELLLRRGPEPPPPYVQAPPTPTPKPAAPVLTLVRPVDDDDPEEEPVH